MMKPVIDCALDAFIRGISIFDDTRNPKNLSESFEHALHAEERHRDSEKNCMVSSYHIVRPRESVFEYAHSPRPFSKQMDNSGKYAKSEGSSSNVNTSTSATLKPNLNMALGAMYGPSAYNRFPSHYPHSFLLGASLKVFNVCTVKTYPRLDIFYGLTSR